MTSGLSAVISQASEQTETPRLGVSLSGLKQASKKHAWASREVSANCNPDQ